MPTGNIGMLLMLCFSASFQRCKLHVYFVLSGSWGVRLQRDLCVIDGHSAALSGPTDRTAPQINAR